MATNYFGELAQVRANGANTRLSLLSNALENRRQEQKDKRKSVMDILADPEYTTESKKQFEQTGNLFVLQSALQVEAQAKAAQEAQDRITYRDMLLAAKRGDGSWNIDALHQMIPNVPQSLSKSHVDMVQALTPKERNIDPNSPEGLDARIKFERMKALIDAEVGGKKAEKQGAQYSPGTLSALNDVQQRMTDTQGKLDTGVYTGPVEKKHWFSATTMEPDTIAYQPQELDSMNAQMKQDAIAEKGYMDILSGKNTWEAQATQQMIDSMYAQEAAALAEEEAQLQRLKAQRGQQ